MVMVAHDRVGTDIDAEDRGEGCEFIDDPLTAMCVILAGERINTAQEGTTYATGYTVVVRSVSEADLVGAGLSHG